MLVGSVILNEQEVREAKSLVSRLDDALSSEAIFTQIVEGLPVQVGEKFRSALETEKAELEHLVQAYEKAKEGDYTELKRRAGNDPGLALIVARIARGLTQKDLARKLGLREQQVQRYEADRYRAISLSSYRKVASVLGVHWDMKLSDWGSGAGWAVAENVSAAAVKKIIKHGKENAWFRDDANEPLRDEESVNYLQRYVSDHIIRYGTPSLLRTGLNVENYADDLSLLAWKARVTRRAEKIIEEQKVEYRPLAIGWLIDLVRLSKENDGPLQARELLASHGIVLIAEPQIPGMKVDGAAFLVNDVPVIGMTLRRDTIDGFWFTLLHEVGHIMLHYRTGLSSGFFDDSELSAVDEIEEEANEFASNMLIPEEKWRRSPARIAKAAEVIERFAEQIGVHPAIVFGRIQKERGDYAIFSNKIGRGRVRNLLIPEGVDVR